MNHRMSTLVIVPFVLTMAGCLTTPIDHPLEPTAMPSMPAMTSVTDPSLPSASMALAGREMSFDEPAPTF